MSACACRHMTYRRHARAHPHGVRELHCRLTALESSCRDRPPPHVHDSKPELARSTDAVDVYN